MRSVYSSSLAGRSRIIEQTQGVGNICGNYLIYRQGGSTVASWQSYRNSDQPHVHPTVWKGSAWLIMPFGFHSHTSSSSQHEQQIPGAFPGILQAAQGSIGAPVGNLNNVLSARTTAGTDRLDPSRATSSHTNSGGQQSA